VAQFGSEDDFEQDSETTGIVTFYVFCFVF
jgi:hypothetical protein